MRDNRTTVNGGIGFVGALQIVFIVLKLTHVIDWKWIWVLAPMWIYVLCIVGIATPFIIYAIVQKRKFKKWMEKKDKEPLR